MERKLISLAVLFFVAIVVVSVKACQLEGQSCATEPCCPEIACINDMCVNCEDHIGHDCEPGVRECCDEEISCVKVSSTEYQCIDCESHIDHECETRDCCPGMTCTGVTPNRKCVCNFQIGQQCTASSNDCCDEVACYPDSLGVYRCTNCEDHVGHDCEPGVRECCDEEIACVQFSAGVYKCTNCESHVDHECEPNVRECCDEEIACIFDSTEEIYKCTDCENHIDHECEPGVRECCDPLMCVNVGGGIYQCKE